MDGRCGTGRQNREDLFKESITCKREISMLRKEAGKTSASRSGIAGRERPFPFPFPFPFPAFPFSIWGCGRTTAPWGSWAGVRISFWAGQHTLYPLGSAWFGITGYLRCSTMPIPS